MLVFNLPTLQLVCNMVYADNQNGSIVNQPQPTTPSPFLPSGYVAYPDFGVAYKVHNEMVTWTVANSRCIEEGARLAAIDSVEKIQVVRNQQPSRNLTHVGFNIMDSESTWYSVNTGLTVTTLPWASGEPNGSGRCAVIKREEIGLGKYSCTGTTGDYVCQIPYPPRDELIGACVSEIPWANNEPAGNSDCVGIKQTEGGLANYNCKLRADFVCEIPIAQSYNLLMSRLAAAAIEASTGK